MLSKFTFHPVGQGLFYTGQLCTHPYFLHKNFNFVYDCGGSPNRINNCVQHFVNNLQNTPNNHTIDALFISHFHWDHINGLMALTQKLKVKRIFMPYYNSFQFILICLLNNANDNDEIKQIVENWDELKSAIEDVDIKSIIPNENSRTETYFLSHKNELLEKSNGAFLYWKFILANNTDKTTVDLINEIINYNTKKLAIKNIENYLLKNITNKKDIDEKINNLLNVDDYLANKYRNMEIEKIVEKFNKNESSLFVIHYPLIGGHLFTEKNSNIFFNSCLCNCCPERESSIQYMYKHSATVLTGDGAISEETNRLLRMQIEKDENELELSIMQIPHHGAKNEWDKTEEVLFSNIYTFKHYIISFGYGNRYGHPAEETLNCLVTHKVQDRLNFVTQFSAFNYFIVDFI